MLALALALALAAAPAAAADASSAFLDLARALANDSSATTFATLAQSAAPQMASVFGNFSGNVTVLVPTNDAFAAYQKENGAPLTNLSAADLVAVLSYHVMAAPLTDRNFTASDRGLIVPTLLTGEQYNNRSAGDALVSLYGSAAAQGQVVFIDKSPINPARLRVRRAPPGVFPGLVIPRDDSTTPTNVNIRGGEGDTASVEPINGQFSQGLYQKIDSIMAPPAPCSYTMRDQAPLSSFNTVINRTGFWDQVDHLTNVTCLAPQNDAFKAAGSPEVGSDKSNLTDLLLLHTLNVSAYSNFLEDGSEFPTMLNGSNVRVSVVDGDVYFNDAKVISPNILTNNGVVHVLDKVMSPNGTPASSSTSKPSSTASSTGGSKPSATKKGAAPALARSMLAWLLVPAAAAVVAL